MAHAPALRFARPLAAFALITLCLTLAGCGINTIPTYEQNAKAAWSEVLNQYKRRADLIPNLVETVKGFADQEKTVLTEVVEARSKATQVQANIPPDILTNPEAMQKFQEAQSQLGGALGRLLAVVERYPDIKSGQNFLTLQSQIEGTENRIAVERMRYNEKVQEYNTSKRQFPSNVTASIFRFKDYPFFEVPPEATQVPKVNFNKS